MNTDTIYNEHDFEVLLCKDKECNFVAIALSPWHANGVDATIEFLKDKGIKLKGYIVIGSHPTKGRFIDQTNFAVKSKDIKIISVDMTVRPWLNKIFTNSYALLKLLFDKKHSTDRTIYICNTCYPDFSWIYRLRRNKHIRINYIVMDEGIGAYYAQDRTDWVNTHLEEKGVSHKNLYLRFVYSALFSIRQMPNKMMVNRLIKNGRLIDNQLLAMNNGKLVENRNISREYKKVFQCIDCEISKNSIPSYADAIVLNTSRLEERDKAVLNYSRKIEESIIDYANKKGIKTVIKPHPRETSFQDYYNLGCFVDVDNKMSQETIVAKLEKKPSLFIALNSSTLINIKTIFQIPTISYAKILLKRNISEIEKDMLRKFVDKFDGIVEFPESVEELLNYIQ